jgi:hypothetical protein
MFEQMNQLSMLFAYIIIACVIIDINAHNSVHSSPRSIKCYWEQDEPPRSYFQGTEGTLEYERRKTVRFRFENSYEVDDLTAIQIYENDPVRTTLLSEYVRCRLQEAEIAAGGTEVFQSLYLAQADPLLLKQIQDELFRA